MKSDHMSDFAFQSRTNLLLGATKTTTKGNYYTQRHGFHEGAQREQSPTADISNADLVGVLDGPKRSLKGSPSKSKKAIKVYKSINSNRVSGGLSSPFGNINMEEFQQKLNGDIQHV